MVKKIVIFMMVILLIKNSKAQEQKNHFSISLGKVASVYQGKMESSFLIDQSYFKTPHSFTLRGWDLDFRYKFKSNQSIALSIQTQTVQIGALYDFYYVVNNEPVYEYIKLGFSPTYFDFGLEYEYPLVNKRKYQLILTNGLSFTNDIVYRINYLGIQNGLTFRFYPVKNIYFDLGVRYNLNIGKDVRGYIYPIEDKTSRFNAGTFTIRPVSFHSEFAIGFQL